MPIPVNPTGTPGQENVVLHRGCNPATCRYWLSDSDYSGGKQGFQTVKGHITNAGLQTLNPFLIISNDSQP